ncbi:10569_t:CDS:2 [Dentiscutata heterogama]|uniref:10569_t:CDS:1 n=1 Tax=Dentiscutata heterogama TaxID=1316150 RepID=A0ACA9LQI2_9GLOM|nr:10569_t:CDS:2 [Dentiscutata heterogama]
MANALSNQYPIILIPSDNIQAVDFQKNIHKDQQGNSSQIDNSEDEIIDDNSESSKVNEQLSEIQVETIDQQI